MGVIINLANDKHLGAPIRLSDICRVLANPTDLWWAVLEFDGLGEPTNFDTMQEYEDAVRYGSDNRWNTWKDLQSIAEWSTEIYWAWIVGMREKEINVEAFEGQLSVRNKIVEIKVSDRESMSIEIASGAELSLLNRAELDKLRSRFNLTSEEVYA